MQHALERTDAQSGKGVGRPLLRKEDTRHLRGRGQFVADVRLRSVLAFELAAPEARAVPVAG